MTTLSEVAARAGVSVRTVSNVVNAYPFVAPQTRSRVQQALDELGYRPNLAARQLRRGYTGMIGLLVPEISSPYFSELASLVVAAAARRDLTVLIDETGGDPRRESGLLHPAGPRVVDGLLLSPWMLSPQVLARGPGSVPLVLLGESPADGVLDHVAVDNVAAAREATDHLIALGRRAIAAVGVRPGPNGNTARLRLKGYRQALDAAGLGPGVEVPVDHLHRRDGAAAVAAMLDAGRRPDALFCFNDELAVGALRTLADRAIRVPEDIALIGFDDVEDSRYTVPSLSTVAPDKQRIAEAALELLVARIASSEQPVRDVVVPHRLVIRESTGGAAQ